MSGEDGVRIAYVALLFLLVIGAVVSRRVPVGQAVRYLLIWAVLFGAAFLLFAMRDDLRPLIDRVRGEIAPQTPQSMGDTARIAMSADGHFWVDGRIGTTDARFLIDSGATITALSADTIRKAGLIVDDRHPLTLQTANGVVQADRVAVPNLSIGSIAVHDLRAVTAPGFGETNVLGMNFLSTLRRWGVEGRTLILEP